MGLKRGASESAGSAERRIVLPRAIEHRPLSELKPYAKNARTHSKSQVAKIARSMREFGWTLPVLVDANGEVIAGHGRLLAAQELGLIEAPVIELSSLTPAQVKAYRLADNKLALDGGWDDALLGEELLELQALDYNLDFTGFDPNEVMGLVGATEAEEVPAPEPPENPVSRVGDVWVCGSHRVMCGDSASVEDVDRLLAGAQIHLAHCDPPYNVNVEPRSNNAIAAGTSSWAPSASAKAHLQGFDVARQGAKQPTGRMRAKDRPLQNDFMSDEAFDAMLLAWFGNIARVLLPGRSFYIWGGYASWRSAGCTSRRGSRGSRITLSSAARISSTTANTRGMAGAKAPRIGGSGRTMSRMSGASRRSRRRRWSISLRSLSSLPCALSSTAASVARACWISLAVAVARSLAPSRQGGART
jgi:hypothetical protein